MFLSKYLDHPKLQLFSKEIPAGQFLFRQGEVGKTMYVILEGVVQLFDETADSTVLIGTYGPGQFFGEKSVLKQTDFQRYFSAQARVRTNVLEFTLKDLAVIQEAVPNFMVVLFQAAVERLDKAYNLIRLLQSEDNMERLIHCIVYFYRCPGVETSANRFVSISSDDIHNLIKMDKPTIQFCLEELYRRNILSKGPDGFYNLRDERGLLSALTEIGEKLPKAS